LQQERIDLVVVAEEKQKAAGLSLAVIVSLVLHVAFILWFVYRSRNAPVAQKSVPMMQYVELIQQNPQQQKFTESPGPAIDKAPLNAPLSDANRKASMPEPTGPNPTKRPGIDDSAIYTPRMPPPTPRQTQQAQAAQQAQQPSVAQPGAAQSSDAKPMQSAPNDTFAYRETVNPNKASAAASAQVDWRNAIREVKGPMGGGGGGPDFGEPGGGERGSAEQGPISFETAWYDWGPYAQSMVSKIRVNWYANMPQLIRTGISGVVTIRFTIQRDGRITDIAVMNSSGHPPYDFAARKAIELSSPLAPLPADFPNPNERVTAMFYYNKKIPA
jgi:TonB family protein